MDLSDRPERLAQRNIRSFLEQRQEMVGNLELVDWSKQLAHYADTGETNEHNETHQKHYCEKNKQVAAWLEGVSDGLARFSLLPGVIWLFFIDSDAEREIAVQCFLRKVDCIQQVLERVISRLWNPPLFQPVYRSAEVISMLALATRRLRLLAFQSLRLMFTMVWCLIRTCVWLVGRLSQIFVRRLGISCSVMCVGAVVAYAWSGTIDTAK